MLRRSLPPQGSAAFLAVTGESAPVDSFVHGLAHRFEGLEKLKNSERNCRFMPSRGSLTSLCSPKSKVKYPGVRNRLRGERSCGCRLATFAVQVGLPAQKSFNVLNALCSPV